MHLGGAFAFSVIVATCFYTFTNAASAPSGESKKKDAVTLEDIPGSTTKRVILSAKATERLGIEMGTVRKDTVVRVQLVGGTVIHPMDGPPEQKLIVGGFAGFTPVSTAPPPAIGGQPTSANGEVWIQVALSPKEYERLAKDQAARIEQLQTREDLKHRLAAQPLVMQPIEEAKRSMLTLYYTLPEMDHGLSMYQRVRVELPLLGTRGPETVVPYGAVYYDAQGAAWVYVNARPLAFERQRVAIDRVVGDLAVLTDGPPVGTKVVTVGAALLYGVEIFGK
jgi:hypothetical protein